MRGALLLAATLPWLSGCVFELAELAERHQIAIDVADAGIDEPLTDVAVPVFVDASRIDYALTADDGTDIRFYAADGTPLAHEIERWDESGRSLVWVKLAELAPGGRRIFLRTGERDAPPDPTSVWTGYLGVYHMAGAASANDSSPRATHGTSTALATDPDSPLGQAALFDGTASSIDLGTLADFDVPLGGARSFEVWFRRATTAFSFMNIVRSRNTCCTGYVLVVLPDEYANLRMDISAGNCCDGTAVDHNLTPFSLPQGAMDLDWHHVVVVMDHGAGQTRVYFDGQLRQSRSDFTGTETLAGGDAAIGVSEFNDGFMNGSIDEVRVSERAFSDSWVRFTYAAALDDVLTFGPVE